MYSFILSRMASKSIPARLSALCGMSWRWPDDGDADFAVRAVIDNVVGCVTQHPQL
jgi:hypothetical protein